MKDDGIKNDNVIDKYQNDRTDNRLALGEAWMWCNDCGAKLYSFDGKADNSRPCPNKKECLDKI